MTYNGKVKNILNIINDLYITVYTLQKKRERERRGEVIIFKGIMAENFSALLTHEFSKDTQ